MARKPKSQLPDALTHYERWGAVQVNGPLKILVISDIHIPYQNNESLQIAIDYGKDQKANMVLINGDMADFFALSFWEKDPRKRNFANEVQAGRQFLEVLREEFLKARIIIKEGNHEERWERYLQMKAPDFLGLDEFTLESVYELKKRRIEFVKDRRPIRLGKLTVIHGHEYRFNISNPVNPARGLFLRGKIHAACGHFHQTSQHSEKRLDDTVVSTWSIGAICDLHPDYAPINNWNHGFAFVEINSGGSFQINNMRIIQGKAYL